jgi:hypothetical protein
MAKREAEANPQNPDLQRRSEEAALRWGLAFRAEAAARVEVNKLEKSALELISKAQEIDKNPLANGRTAEQSRDLAIATRQAAQQLVDQAKKIRQDNKLKGGSRGGRTDKKRRNKNRTHTKRR